MKDVNQPLRRAYFDALSVLSYESQLLNVHDDIVPDLYTQSREFRYVILSTQTDTDQRPKNKFIHNATILVNIVNGVTGNAGKRRVDEIAELVMQAIYPVSSDDYLDLSSSNLQIVTTEKVSDTTDFVGNNTHKTWIRSIRFRHIISEL